MKILAGNDLFRTLNLYTNQRALLIRKLRDFLQFKERSPYNGRAPDGARYGGTDYMFRTDGKFSAMRGIAHAHLTGDISIVYRIDGDTIRLYGVYTHDAIGTGQPPSTNRQEQNLEVWKNTDFSDFEAGALGSEPEEAPAEPKSKPKRGGSPASYAPKPKATPPNPYPRLQQLIQDADSQWPQRRLLDSSSAVGFSNKAGIENILRSEMSYIRMLQQRRVQFFPNQLRYINALNAIAKELTG